MKTLLNPSFVSVIFAQVASLFGDAVLRFALPLYVLNLTGSAALMGAVAAAAWIPYIVLTPIGGVAADRVPRARRHHRPHRPVHLRAHHPVRRAERVSAHRAGGGALHRAA